MQITSLDRLRPTRALAHLLTLAMGLAAAGFGPGCAQGQPPLVKAAARAECGDQCRSMSCPADTHCAFSENCTPRCELNVLPRR